MSNKHLVLTDGIEGNYYYIHVPGWLWYNGFYKILYDDTVVDIRSTKKEAEKLCKLLNAAYYLGKLAAS